MIIAQIAPSAGTNSNVTTLAQETFFIIGNLQNTVPKAPENWNSILVHVIALIAIAYGAGWICSLILRWASIQFRRSPITKATVAALGKSIPFILPAYTLLFLIKSNAAYLAHAEWLSFSITAGTFLCSLAHTTAIYHFVAIPIAWAQTLAVRTTNKLDDILVPMLGTVARIAVVVIGGFKAISLVDPKSSDAILGLLAGAFVGLAFASQDTVKNIFGAVMLIVDQPFTLGDTIHIGSHEGKVESLGLRSTTIVLVDGQRLAIPNGDLATRPIVNLSRRDFIRAQELIHLDANTPFAKVNKALEIIRSLLVEHEGSQASHPPLVHVHEFGERTINIRVMYWYFPAQGAKQLEFNQQLLLRITQQLQQAEIPLSTLVISPSH